MKGMLSFNEKGQYILTQNAMMRTNLTEMMTENLMDRVEIHITNAENRQTLFFQQGKLEMKPYNAISGRGRRKNTKGKKLYTYHCNNKDFDNQVLWDLVHKGIEIDFKMVNKTEDAEQNKIKEGLTF